MIVRSLTHPEAPDQHSVLEVTFREVPLYRSTATYHPWVRGCHLLYGVTIVDVQLNDPSGAVSSSDDSVIPSLRTKWEPEDGRPRPLRMFVQVCNSVSGERACTWFTFEPTWARRPNYPDASPEDENTEQWRYLETVYDVDAVPSPIDGRTFIHRVVPTAHHTLIYIVKRDVIVASPPIFGIYVHAPEISSYEPLRRVYWNPGPNGQPISAIAWDDTVGRICFTTPNSTTVTLLDFGKRLRHGELPKPQSTQFQR